MMNEGLSRCRSGTLLREDTGESSISRCKLKRAAPPPLPCLFRVGAAADSSQADPCALP